MSVVLPLVEPIFCPDMFATGFTVHMLSPVCVRLTFFSEQLTERVVVAKIVRPIPLLIARDRLIRLASAEASVALVH